MAGAFRGENIAVGISWYTANILTISVFNALSIGGGLVAAVFLCMKRGVFSPYQLRYTYYIEGSIDQLMTVGLCQ